MEGNATGKPFKMKGHSLPGINQRSEGNTDLPDGRSGSAAFQYRSPVKTEGHGGAEGHTHEDKPKHTKKSVKTQEEIDAWQANNPNATNEEFNAWLTGYMKPGNE